MDKNTPYPGAAPAPGFIAPPPPYNSPPPSAATVTVVHVPSAPLGRNPIRLQCPHCRETTTTNVNHVSSSRTHLFALLLCLICPLGCCFIPYCVDSCQSADHTCPSCNNHIGTYAN